MATGFENIHFKGEFREYQKRVLDRAPEYLADGKINVVAAPGSGKTILGLELICRLKSPCLILSPTTAIRDQWGLRFKEAFLDNKADYEVMFSTDLNNISLINSITYQALYSAMEKTVCVEEDGEKDYTKIDLIKIIKARKIKTICLDEAHHLKNIWQKALEKFIDLLDDDVKIISLTATPPYDSSLNEWNKYIKVCGEVDEEIFVPELVSNNSLCPHQDYIYFNYPTNEECEIFSEYKERALLAVEEIGKLDFIKEFCDKLNNEKDYDKLFSSCESYVSALVLFKFYGFEISKKIIRLLTCKKELPEFSFHHCEIAVSFFLENEEFSDDEKEAIIKILKDNSLYNKGKAELELNESLKHQMISSVGKLKSIENITSQEHENLGENLRMLILTDYIKKEELSNVATDNKFNSVSVVSIFETIRRSNNKVRMGVLSGSLIVLPKNIELPSDKFKKDDIEGTEYCQVDFKTSNSVAVSFVSKLLENGDIQVLIGTKSLLGEGWDSPCINTLILASFVGSYVLSNQMRGRAIRVDKRNPQKTANIWHLVTVEPPSAFENLKLKKLLIKTNKNQIMSYDFEVLKRRFDSFIGPNYSTGEIESGIDRITDIKPPFDEAGIERLNDEMLALSKNRELFKDAWKNELSKGKATVNIENNIDSRKRVPVFTFSNFAFMMMFLIFQVIVINSFKINFGGIESLLLAVVEILSLCGVLILLKTIFNHFNPAKSIKSLSVAVHKTLKECGIISVDSVVKTTEGIRGDSVNVYLSNASIHDQNIFNIAISELLSPIENPRYIIVKRNIFGKNRYSISYACPSVIGQKKEFVQCLCKNLKSTTGSFNLIYTRNESGRKTVLKCRKNSYITFNQKMIDRKFKVSSCK